MCKQAPAYRSGAAAHQHYTRQHVAGLIQQVGWCCVLHQDGQPSLG
jgi:hypothetical protein